MKIESILNLKDIQEPENPSEFINIALSTFNYFFSEDRVEHMLEPTRTAELLYRKIRMDEFRTFWNDNKNKSTFELLENLILGQYPFTLRLFTEQAQTSDFSYMFILLKDIIIRKKYPYNNSFLEQVYVNYLYRIFKIFLITKYQESPLFPNFLYEFKIYGKKDYPDINTKATIYSRRSFDIIASVLLNINYNCKGVSCYPYDISYIITKCFDRVYSIFIKPIVTNHIYLYFPYKRISNVREEYLDLYDIYIDVQFTNFGKIKSFDLLRSTVSCKEYISKYAHSHCSSGVFKFGNLCLGDGPLVTTLFKLKALHDIIEENPIEFEKNVEKYKVLLKLFSFELDKYLEVESIAGGPYILMSKVLKLSFDPNKYNAISDMDSYIFDYNSYLMYSSIFSKETTLKLYQSILPKLDIVFKNDHLKIATPLKEFVNIVTENIFTPDFIQNITQDRDNFNRLAGRPSLGSDIEILPIFVNQNGLVIKDAYDVLKTFNEIENSNSKFTPTCIFYFKNRIVYKKVIKDKNTEVKQYETVNMLSNNYFPDCLAPYYFIYKYLTYLINSNLLQS